MQTDNMFTNPNESFNNLMQEAEMQNQQNNNNKKKKSNFFLILLLMLFTSFMSVLFTLFIIVKFPKITAKSVTTVTKEDITITEEGLSSSVSKVYDAVVIVKNYKYGSLYATGTGFVYKKDAGRYYLLTNYHVIKEANQVKIVLTTGEEYEVTVLGGDQFADIAVLEYKSNKDLKVIEIGDNTKTKVGDTVFAIGAPLDSSVYSWSVTRGVLSGKDREVAVKVASNTTSDWIMNVLQTDAAINSGNSGGPLCNVNGEVIGITNMKLIDSAIEGIGFAIPIEDATFYADAIIKGEDITRPKLGISMYDVNSKSLYKVEGAVAGVGVSMVYPSSPAENGGLNVGDVIIALDGVDVKNVAELRVQLYKHKFGDKVKVKYIRNGQAYTTEIDLFKYTG